MADVVLFHHVQGLTDGVRALADSLSAGGRRVVTPDLFDGARPRTLDEGMALDRDLGNVTLRERAERAIAGLAEDVVYAGVSLGVGVAQEFAQTRPGARGALLYEGCLPVVGEWAVGPWPEGLAVQIHGMSRDPYFALGGDLEAARELVAVAGDDRAALFVYEGDQHLFTDSSLASYDADATQLVLQRSLEFLDRFG